MEAAKWSWSDSSDMELVDAKIEQWMNISSHEKGKIVESLANSLMIISIPWNGGKKSIGDMLNGRRQMPSPVRSLKQANPSTTGVRHIFVPSLIFVGAISFGWDFLMGGGGGNGISGRGFGIGGKWIRRLDG